MMKKTIMLSVFLFLGLQLAFNAQSLANENKQDQYNILLCERLIHKYAFIRDQLDYDSYGALFTPDAEFKIGSKMIKGRDNIVNAVKKRGPLKLNRHMMTSVYVEDHKIYGLIGKSYAFILEADKNEKPPHILSLKSLSAAVTYEDRFVIKESKCLFSKRNVKIDFLKNNTGVK